MGSQSGPPVIERWSPQTHPQTHIKLMQGWKSALAASEDVLLKF